MQPPDTRIHVVLADDHKLVRAALRSLLQGIRHVNVVAEADDGRELLAILESIQPDVVITDVSMPDMDGISAISEIRRKYPRQRIIVVSMHASPDVIKRAVAAGANGYVRKDASDFELESALQSVTTVGSYFSADVMKALLQPAEPSAEKELTERQLEILKRVAAGRSSKEIGFELGLSPKTVDVHRARIMERLGLRDVASLTLYAVRQGLMKID